MGRPDLVLMGRASGAFGLKGEIKVFPHSRDPGVFLRAGRVYLGPNPEAAQVRAVRASRMHAGRLLLTLEGVGDRDAAAGLSGQWVYLESAELSPLAPDEYYWHQIKGCLVKTTQGVELGRVAEVSRPGAHDLLLVKAPDGKEALIPVVEGMVLSVDTAQGLVLVDLPPGLLDAQGWPEEEKALVAEPEGQAS